MPLVGVSSHGGYAHTRPNRVARADVAAARGVAGGTVLSPAQWMQGPPCEATPEWSPEPRDPFELAHDPVLGDRRSRRTDAPAAHTRLVMGPMPSSYPHLLPTESRGHGNSLTIHHSGRDADFPAGSDGGAGGLGPPLFRRAPMRVRHHAPPPGITATAPHSPCLSSVVSRVRAVGRAMDEAVAAIEAREAMDAARRRLIAEMRHGMEGGKLAHHSGAGLSLSLVPHLIPTTETAPPEALWGSSKIRVVFRRRSSSRQPNSRSPNMASGGGRRNSSEGSNDQSTLGVCNASSQLGNNGSPGLSPPPSGASAERAAPSPNTGSVRPVGADARRADASLPMDRSSPHRQRSIVASTPQAGHSSDVRAGEQLEGAPPPHPRPSGATTPDRSTPTNSSAAPAKHLQLSTLPPLPVDQPDPAVTQPRQNDHPGAVGSNARVESPVVRSGQATPVRARVAQSSGAANRSTTPLTAVGAVANASAMANAAAFRSGREQPSAERRRGSPMTPFSDSGKRLLGRGRMLLPPTLTAPSEAVGSAPAPFSRTSSAGNFVTSRNLCTPVMSPLASGSSQELPPRLPRRSSLTSMGRGEAGNGVSRLSVTDALLVRLSGSFGGGGGNSLRLSRTLSSTQLHSSVVADMDATVTPSDVRCTNKTRPQVSASFVDAPFRRYSSAEHIFRRRSSLGDSQNSAAGNGGASRLATPVRTAGGSEPLRHPATGEPSNTVKSPEAAPRRDSVERQTDSRLYSRVMRRERVPVPDAVKRRGSTNIAVGPDDGAAVLAADSKPSSSMPAAPKGEQNATSATTNGEAPSHQSNPSAGRVQLQARALREAYQRKSAEAAESRSREVAAKPVSTRTAKSSGRRDGITGATAAPVAVSAPGEPPSDSKSLVDRRCPGATGSAAIPTSSSAGAAAEVPERMQNPLFGKPPLPAAGGSSTAPSSEPAHAAVPGASRAAAGRSRQRSKSDPLSEVASAAAAACGFHFDVLGGSAGRSGPGPTPERETNSSSSGSHPPQPISEVKDSPSHPAAIPSSFAYAMQAEFTKPRGRYDYLFKYSRYGGTPARAEALKTTVVPVTSAAVRGRPAARREHSETAEAAETVTEGSAAGAPAVRRRHSLPVKSSRREHGAHLATRGGSSLSSSSATKEGPNAGDTASPAAVAEGAAAASAALAATPPSGSFSGDGRSTPMEVFRPSPVLVSGRVASALAIGFTAARGYLERSCQENSNPSTSTVAKPDAVGAVSTAVASDRPALAVVRKRFVFETAKDVSSAVPPSHVSSDGAEPTAALAQAAETVKYPPRAPRSSSGKEAPVAVTPTNNEKEEGGGGDDDDDDYDEDDMYFWQVYDPADEHLYVAPPPAVEVPRLDLRMLYRPTVVLHRYRLTSAKKAGTRLCGRAAKVGGASAVIEARDAAADSASRVEPAEGCEAQALDDVARREKALAKATEGVGRRRAAAAGAASASMKHTSESAGSQSTRSIDTNASSRLPSGYARRLAAKSGATPGAPVSDMAHESVVDSGSKDDDDAGLTPPVVSPTVAAAIATLLIEREEEREEDMRSRRNIAARQMLIGQEYRERFSLELGWKREFQALRIVHETALTELRRQVRSVTEVSRRFSTG